ncbi:MSCRAMM family protein [Paraurantiacibacter namhicola]|uniref:Cna protein B-type domain protein n=1 Tax=Paraurantiacibacter namhicola TaxID=645517 RepID=A0A1C7D5J6_9SPHN|nr:carboxypeptidase-like regulatory domain-containing protein [Paraurantiacibacter namhicola]ANU06740.1 hypothetical protein A6F65_00415 [Paraurantiacibacter namhicola]
MRILRAFATRAAAITAAALVASAPLSPASAQDAATPSTWQANEDDFILLEPQVKKYRLTFELRGYQTPGGTCVDLADVIQSFDLPVRLDKKSRRATGWLFSEQRTFTLDRDSNTVQIVNKRRDLRTGELYDTPEGWCVDTKSLSDWLGVSLTPNLFESVLKVESDAPLPFIQRIERESRAARLSGRAPTDLSKLPQARNDYQTFRLPSVDVVARVGHKSDGSSTRTTGQYEIFATGELASASFEARLASDDQGTPASLRMRAYRVQPEGGMLGPLDATQVGVGDVDYPGGQLAGGPAVGRGLFVSNQPLNRPNTFGKTVVRGALPVGWDAELYRNGQLLAFQPSPIDGRYEFEVDLLLGRNELEIVLYGPQGQIRKDTRSIPVGYSALEPGKLEYWAGAVERNRDLISFSSSSVRPEGGWIFGAGAQYGIDQRTSAGVSAQSMYLFGKQRYYVEGSVQRSLGPVLVNVTGAQEFGAGQAFRAEAIGRFGRTNFRAETFFTNGGYTSGTIRPDEKSAQRFEIDHSLKLGKQDMPVAFGFSRSVRRDGQKVNEFLLRGSLILPQVSLTGFVLHRDVSGVPPGSSEADQTRVGVLANTRFLGFRMRGEAQFRISGPDQGFESARISADRAIGVRSDLRVDVQHFARTNVTQFGAGYIHQFDKFALQAGGTLDTRGSYGLNLFISFSVGPDPLSGGWHMSNEKLAQRGQAAVSVFVDRNGNGRREPGEEALPNVGVTAGQFGSSAPTDEDGHAFVAGLDPYRQVLVGIDSSTLEDPFLVPRGKGVVVTPRPGVAATVELAVTPTGEVEGMLLDAEERPRPGVKLELVRSDGEVAATTISEYDGFFLFDRVPYGDYALRISADSARVLSVRRELATGLAVGDAQPVQNAGTIRLSPIEVADNSP